MYHGMNYLEHCCQYDKLDYGQVIGSFNKLRQTRSLTNYSDTFEDLRASMLEFNPLPTKTRLQNEIKRNMNMFKPQTLEEVYDLAENEEKKLDALTRQGSYPKWSGQF